MDDAIYLSHDEVREQGRRAALGGRPVFANPHLGGEAELWFMGYRSVPEEQRGSQPAPASTRIARKKRRGGFHKMHLKGSTPKPTPRPWGEL